MRHINTARKAYNDGIIGNIISIHQILDIADAMKKPNNLPELVQEVDEDKLYCEVKQSNTRTKILLNKKRRKPSVGILVFLLKSRIENNKL